MRIKTETLRDYLLITLGAFLVAFAVSFFLVPMKVSTGGVSGIGTVLYHVFSIPMSVTTLIANAALFLLGARMLRRSRITRTAFGVVMLAVFLELVKVFGAYSEDILIASVFGGILSGTGIGLTICADGSTGGSDFAAVMLNNRFPHMSVTTLLMLTDAVIITVSGIVFGDFTVTLYSAISLYISSKCADMMIVRGDSAKSVFIISQKSREISERILTELSRGVTGIYSRGQYKDKDTVMLMCIVRPKEIPQLLTITKSIDPSAFTIVSDIKKVHGKGF